MRGPSWREQLLRSAALLACVVAGCVPPSLDLSDRLCPCAEGWSCVAERCVPLSSRQDASVRDAGPGDAATVDAARSDGAVEHDAGARDAGPADAALGDAGELASECAGALASAILCDGFETDPGPWESPLIRSGVVATTSTRAQRGARALHAETTATNGQAALTSPELGAFMDGDLWARASIYLPASAIADDFTFMYTGEGVDPYEGISLGVGAGVAGAYSTLTATYVSNDALIVPRDRWVCFELHIAVSATAGTIEIYMDGERFASMSGLRTLPASGYRYFVAGLDYTDPAQPPVEIFMDEVVYSRTRLPCP